MAAPKDTIVSENIQLNPGFWWTDEKGNEHEITDAQVCLLRNKDNRVIDAINDIAEREEKRYLWSIYRLGPFVGRDVITQEMVGEMWPPDIVKLRERMVSLHNSFLDTPNATCPYCGSEFKCSLIKTETQPAQATD